MVEVAGLEARVDSPSWSITAWIQLPAGGSANIILKPRGKEQHVCWSWRGGMPNASFEFRVHDFRGDGWAAQVIKDKDG